MVDPRFVASAKSAESISSIFRDDVLARREAAGQINIGGTVGATTGTSTGATTGPTRTPTDQGIEVLDFPHVRPGDLITAEFINKLIDVVVDIDSRLQRIEILAARANVRKVDTDNSPPQVVGKP